MLHAACSLLHVASKLHYVLLFDAFCIEGKVGLPSMCLVTLWSNSRGGANKDEKPANLQATLGLSLEQKLSARASWFMHVFSVKKCTLKAKNPNTTYHTIQHFFAFPRLPPRESVAKRMFNTVAWRRLAGQAGSESVLEDAHVLLLFACCSYWYWGHWSLSRCCQRNAIKCCPVTSPCCWRWLSSAAAAAAAHHLICKADKGQRAFSAWPGQKPKGCLQMAGQQQGAGHTGAWRA